MRKIIFAILSLTLCMYVLTACDNGKTDNPSEKTAYAYCTEFYNAGFGNYGSFIVAPADDFELETNFDDLSALSLGGAFRDMSIAGAALAEDEYAVIFYVEGSLAEGDFGIISGEGIIKGKSVEVNVPIAQAEADSSSVIYGNIAEQQIEIELTSACFNKSISSEDFVLSGAARTMMVKSVSTDYVIVEGEDILSGTAVLTLTGEPDGTDYAYIEISSNATTYNQPLNVTVSTDFYGAKILNDHIDTFTLKEIVYVQANNVVFMNSIQKNNISFGGVLKDYAVLDAIDCVNENLIGLHLSFPYTFVNESVSIGYIAFDADTNAERIEFSCSARVAAPSIDFTLKQNSNTVEIELILEHEEFNLFSSYPFSVFNESGKEILVSELNIIDWEEYLSISFVLPDDCAGILYFELRDAYDVVNSDGQTENVTIRFSFYI